MALADPLPDQSHGAALWRDGAAESGGRGEGGGQAWGPSLPPQGGVVGVGGEPWKPLEALVEVLAELWAHLPLHLRDGGVCPLSGVMFDFFFVAFF